MSNEFDVQRPATEAEIAEAVRWAADRDAEVVRRLAFQRDRWRENIREALRLFRAGCVESVERTLEKMLGE